MLRGEQAVDWVPEGYELLPSVQPDEILEKAGPEQEIVLTEQEASIE